MGRAFSSVSTFLNALFPFQGPKLQNFFQRKHVAIGVTSVKITGKKATVGVNNASKHYDYRGFFFVEAFKSVIVLHFQGTILGALPVLASREVAGIRRLQVELDQRRNDELLQEDRRRRARQLRH
jgi:hypothetical protein